MAKTLVATMAGPKLIQDFGHIFDGANLLNDLNAACRKLIHPAPCREAVSQYRKALAYQGANDWATYLGVPVAAGPELASQFPHRQLAGRGFKRVLDIGCALIGLLVAAPVVAGLAALIYLESPGPVFYGQTRLGLDGRAFRILKMRSMKLNADNVPGGGWTVKNDPRRLRIGAFMREWNLDELPQLWNVLVGDMSLVGPRPERPHLVENFKQSIRYYDLRLSCKCGLTGWAAVHGLRGDTSIEDRVAYDLYYIKNWSFWLDLKTILLTFIPSANAY